MRARTVLSSLVAAGSAVASAQQPSPPPGAVEEYVQVSGRTHPELIPEHALWEAGFGTLALDPAESPEKRERFITGLSRHALYMPVDEVALIVEVSGRVRDQIREELRPVEEQVPGPDGTFRAYYARVPPLVLAARDELAIRLSPESFEKLKHWLDKDVAPGLIVGVRGSALPAGVTP
jgi:hypothetical protein